MKAKVIKTGEIIDVIPQTNPNAVSASDILYSSDYRTYKGQELDFTNIKDKGIDWEQRRYEIAKAAMQRILSNQWDDVMNNPEEYQYVATSAVKFADALIAELKKAAK